MAREIGEYIDELVGLEGTPEDLRTAFSLVARASGNLMWDRHRQYGANNIKKFGLHGIVIRASDKLERLATMVFGADKSGSIEMLASYVDEYEPQFNENNAGIVNVALRFFSLVRSIVKPVDTTNESVEDSLGDLSNYGTIGILVQRGWWQLPFYDEPVDEPTLPVDGPVGEGDNYDPLAVIKAQYERATREGSKRIDTVVEALSGVGPNVDRRTEDYLKVDKHTTGATPWMGDFSWRPEYKPRVSDDDEPKDEKSEDE